MGYMCTRKAEWVIGLDICICYDEKLLEDLSKEQFGVKYKRYIAWLCNETKIILEMQEYHNEAWILMNNSYCFRCCTGSGVVNRIKSKGKGPPKETISCVSQIGSNKSMSGDTCSKPFERHYMFVNGMPEDENHRLAKVHDDGDYLHVRYKKQVQTRNNGHNDVMLPLNFSNYCVSISHTSRDVCAYYIVHLDWYLTNIFV